MRKLPLLLALVALPSVAAAAPPKQCTDPLRAWENDTRTIETANRKAKIGQQAPLPKLMLDGSHLDCLKDDVLVLNGEALGNLPDDPPGTPPVALATCVPNAMDPKKLDCNIDYRRAVKRALDLIGAVPDTQWDQLVIFGQDMSPANPAGPLFFREGRFVDPGGQVVSTGVNEVANIGLPLNEMTKRVPGRPMVGYITAGGTDQIANFIDAAIDAPAPKLPKEDPTGPLLPFAGCLDTAQGVCFVGYHNFFDALAQATGMIYGPYLRGPLDDAKNPAGQLLYAPLSVPPWSKSELGGVDIAAYKLRLKSPTTQYALEARIWNSFLDLQGSIMAGSTFRDNGNQTYETTRPPPYYGINVPFASGWKPGTVLSGTRMLRFQPLDLYVMGLLPLDQLPPTIRSFATQAAAQVVKPDLGNQPKFFSTVGPMMGLRPNVAIRPQIRQGNSAVVEEDITMQVGAILGANGGERAPAFKDARHTIKQLWVVVSKPVGAIEKDAKDDDDKQLKQAMALQHLDALVNWRHQFAAYYYMLTGYRGRVTTTFDGADDNAYFEFGQPLDDAMGFQPDDGVAVTNAGVERVNPTTPDLKSVLRFNTVPGAGAGVTYTGKPFALRISGNQSSSRVPVNSVAVRMRVPPGVPAGAVATITFNDGPTVRLPGSCNGRAGCKEAGSLVNDGKWHTYSANLGENAGFADKTFTSFKFSPSDKPYDSGDPAEGIEVDYIRMAYLPSAGDTDETRVACSECGKLPDGEAGKACSKLCQGKEGTERVVVAQPDGFLDSEDNCPNTFNPLQEDGDNNGVGDACEDFDNDGVVNAWDNCPTVSNSRQRDQDGDGKGDVCDTSPGSGCFLNPGSLGGPPPAAPGAVAGVLAAGLIGLIIVRRRRSK